MKTASPERVRKAQLALAESYVRVGRSADALRASKQALDGATAGRSAAGAVHPGARAADGGGEPARTEGDAIRAKRRRCSRSCRPAAGRGARAPRRSCGTGSTIRRTGPGPKAKDVPPPPVGMGRDEAARRVRASSRRRFRGSSRCSPRPTTRTEEEPGRGALSARARALPERRSRRRDRRLRSGPRARRRAAYRDDAGYLRFKASEARYAADPSAANEPAYEQALIAFLREFPKHKAAPEARFRLGELRQRQEQARRGRGRVRAGEGRSVVRGARRVRERAVSREAPRADAGRQQARSRAHDARADRARRVLGASSKAATPKELGDAPRRRPERAGGAHERLPRGAHRAARLRARARAGSTGSRRSTRSSRASGRRS